jgi:hypothetical protein
MAVSYPLQTNKQPDGRRRFRGAYACQPAHIPSLAALDLNLEAAMRTGRAAYSRGAVLFYRPPTQLAANSKLVASLLHMLVCGYDRLSYRDPGDRLYSVWYPPRPAESSKQIASLNLWSRLRRDYRLAPFGWRTESFADTVPRLQC